MSGSSGQGVHSVARDNSPFLSAADDQNISSLLSASAWNGVSVSFSFPTLSADYGTQSTYGDPAPFNGFAPLTAQQQGEVLRALSLISSYTNLTFTKITETTTTHAAIRLANSSSPPTSYAYYPSTAPTGGDVFYGGTGQHPAMGNFDSGQATLHEIGHALGLKHGQDNNTYGVMNANRRDIEFSLMNYPNYIGSTEGFATAAQSPQTYMMYDIAALQYMYGANFSKVGQNVTYTWSATTGEEFVNGVSQGKPFDNHIFETIWTAGANSTYDLSNFSQDQVDDMNPGGWLDFSTSQLADLNAFAPSKPQGEIFARADVYNALEYNGDVRSLIDNIITGSGSDTIIGNAANNIINGGSGTNTFVETGNHTNYQFQQLSTGYIQVADLRSGSPDGTDQVVNIQNFKFADGTYTIDQLLPITPPPVGAAAANDFNADGHSDILLQHINGTPQIWLMNGLSITSSSLLLNPGATWHAAATGDVNLDGKADLIWQNDDGRPAIWEINGTAIIGGGLLVNPGPSWHVIAAGDYNADGRADILWQNTDGAAAIWEMNGTAIVGGGVVSGPAPGWQVIGAGDFNGDHRADILWQYSDGLPLIWEMDGTTVIGSGFLPNPGPSWHAIGTGDFNADGHDDILWQNNDGAPAIWEMNGTTIIGGGLLVNPGTSWHAIGTSDFNADGHADIIWQNTDGTPAVWEMNGTAIIGGGLLPNPGASWHVKNDGPIPPDQMVAASAAGPPSVPGGAVPLAAPDGTSSAQGLAAVPGDLIDPITFDPMAPKVMGSSVFGIGT